MSSVRIAGSAPAEVCCRQAAASWMRYHPRWTRCKDEARRRGQRTTVRAAQHSALLQHALECQQPRRLADGGCDGAHDLAAPWAACAEDKRASRALAAVKALLVRRQLLLHLRRSGRAQRAQQHGGAHRAVALGPCARRRRSLLRCPPPHTQMPCAQVRTHEHATSNTHKALAMRSATQRRDSRAAPAYAPSLRNRAHPTAGVRCHGGCSRGQTPTSHSAATAAAVAAIRTRSASGPASASHRHIGAAAACHRRARCCTGSAVCTPCSSGRCSRSRRRRGLLLRSEGIHARSAVVATHRRSRPPSQAASSVQARSCVRKQSLAPGWARTA